MPDDSFKEFVLDQLSALPDVRAKAMFGAHGIYSGDHFFGILDEGRLFFKTDASSQADYTARGMGPFTYESKGKVHTMGYHEVPPDVLEQPQELAAWARKAIAIDAECRLYDRLFTEAEPEKDGRDFKSVLNPHSLEVVTAKCEPDLKP